MTDPLPDYCRIHTVETRPRAGDEERAAEAWPEHTSREADAMLAKEAEYIEQVKRIIENAWNR